tara:strand:+ start:736 stop:1434 length:699 start_codon:yes stop_codon:yes gene_type:complete
MKFIYYFVFISLIISCDNGKINTAQVIKKPQSSLVKTHEEVANIETEFKLEIDTWKEYENLDIFLNQYISISPNDALNNSRELNDITTSFNDSIKPIFLETPAFNARINLLFNETLRLYDMSSIPAIKAEEVNEQVDRVLNAFSSINFKINTILKQRELEGNVGEINFKIKEPKNLIIDPIINKYKPLVIKKGRKKKISKKSEKMIFFEEDLLKKKKNSIRKIKKNVKNNDN